MSSCSNTRSISDRSVMVTVNSARVNPDSMEWGSTTSGIQRARRRRAGDLAGQAEAAAGAVEGQAPLAGRARPHVAARGVAGAVLRIRRGAVLPLRRSRRETIAAQRRAGFMRLSRAFQGALRQDARADRARSADGISDLQFTDAYRVPFQYSRFVRQHLPLGSFLQSSAGVTVTDLDGNTFYDLTGSYGVNLFGYDFYKDCIERGARAGPRPRPGARRLSSGGRRQRPALAGDLRPRRGVVPHVRHRGRHAGGAACALSHRAARTWCASAAPITAGGATCSRASAIRCRRATPTR